MPPSEMLAFGFDAKTAENLAGWVLPLGVRVRAVQNEEACLNLLRKGGFGAAVVRVGRDLETELRLVAAVAAGFPEVAIVAVEDGAHPELAALLWDLGASVAIATRQQGLLAETLQRLANRAAHGS